MATKPNLTFTSSDLYGWAYHPLTVSHVVGEVSVGTSATKIPTTALAGRRSLTILNIGSAPIYLGASAVTVAAGFRLDAGAFWTFNVGDDVDIYGIASGSAVLTRIMELK